MQLRPPLLQAYIMGTLRVGPSRLIPGFVLTGSKKRQSAVLIEGVALFVRRRDVSTMIPISRDRYFLCNMYNIRCR